MLIHDDCSIAGRSVKYKEQFGAFDILQTPLYSDTEQGESLHGF